jgi:hypothetical protein
MKVDDGSLRLFVNIVTGSSYCSKGGNAISINNLLCQLAI